MIIYLKPFQNAVDYINWLILVNSLFFVLIKAKKSFQFLLNVAFQTISVNVFIHNN